MGITDSIKGAFQKGASKVVQSAAKTTIGKKIVDKAIDKHLENLPEGQREMAKKAIQNMQNMSEEEQKDIAAKMKKLMGGKENPSQFEMLAKFKSMSPQERAEYEELARKMMGM